MSKIKSCQLKTTCIHNVPIDSYENFTFIVNGKEFKTSRLNSELLSPIICKLHQNDPTIDEYIINTRSQGDFSCVLNFTKFHKVQINDQEIPFFIEIIEKLGIERDDIEIEGEIEDLNLTIDNVFDNYKFHSNYDKLFKHQIEREIEFITSHFSELLNKKKEEMIKLPIDTLSYIINSENFQINNEDELLKFVNELYSKSSMYSILYENILFENVSVKTINDFISIYDINDINLNIWKRLCKRLEDEIQKKTVIKTRYKNNGNDELKFQIISKKHEEGKEFEGIFKYLTKSSGDNITKNGTIAITSNSIANDVFNYQPSNLVDFKKNESKFYYTSKFDIKDGYVCFDFIDKLVQISSYSIKSFNAEKNWYHLKNWNIEVSNDGIEWEIIDEHRNDSTLNGKKIIGNFNIKNMTNFYRYFRIHQTGKNWGNDYCMIFYSIEIYGQLKKPISK